MCPLFFDPSVHIYANIPTFHVFQTKYFQPELNRQSCYRLRDAKLLKLDDLQEMIILLTDSIPCVFFFMISFFLFVFRFLSFFFLILLLGFFPFFFLILFFLSLLFSFLFFPFLFLLFSSCKKQKKTLKIRRSRDKRSRSPSFAEDRPGTKLHHTNRM